MNWIQDLTLHVDALLAAMESDKKFFAPVVHYVRELKRVLGLPSAQVSVTNPRQATYFHFPEDRGGAGQASTQPLGVQR